MPKETNKQNFGFQDDFATIFTPFEIKRTTSLKEEVPVENFHQDISSNLYKFRSRAEQNFLPVTTRAKGPPFHPIEGNI